MDVLGRGSPHCQHLEPAADLSGAMAATIERLEGDGWQAEGTAEYGFVFIRREGERRLLMLTERDPHSTDEGILTADARQH
jgi:hypothetical protein